MMPRLRLCPTPRGDGKFRTAAIDPCLIRSTNAHGELLVRLGVPVLDDYLRFVAARARPNTVLATAYDLAVFFRVVWCLRRR